MVDIHWINKKYIKKKLKQGLEEINPRKLNLYIWVQTKIFLYFLFFKQ